MSVFYGSDSDSNAPFNQKECYSCGGSGVMDVWDSSLEDWDIKECQTCFGSGEVPMWETPDKYDIDLHDGYNN